MINPFEYYQRLIEMLCDLPDTLILPLYEIQKTPSDGKRLIGLRHDIDSNPGMALKAARFLASKGICGSFYLQPTAPYYSKCEKLIQNLIVTGCEIGIHNDVYGAYQKGKDGLKQLKQEISYLRGLGAQIHGTTAHATAALYGAENFEIFKEYVLYSRSTRYPIGKISEKSLGLSYEGNFPIPRKNPSLEDIQNFHKDLGDIRNEWWMMMYLIANPTYKRNIDYQVWLLAKDRWVIAGKKLFEWNLNLHKLMNEIKYLPRDTRTILVIHPDYFEVEKMEEETKKDYPKKLRKYQIIFSRKRRKLSRWLFNSLPLKTRWLISLRRYKKWVRLPLKTDYLKETIKYGNDFAEWIGPPRRCIDIGCGNGLFGGMPYADIGYSYLKNDDESYIVGVDPLTSEGPLAPWLDEFHEGVSAEDLPFPDNSFENAVMATSLDHVIDPVKSLKECKRVITGSLFIWVTCLNKKYLGDFDHPKPFDSWELYLMLENAGLNVIRQKILIENDYSVMLFLEAKEIKK